MYTDYQSFIFPVSNVTKKFLICPFLFKVSFPEKS